MSSITERLSALLARTAPFDHMSPEERKDLIGDMTLEIYEPGEVILKEGDDIHRALYMVESGLVRLMDEENNKLIDMCGEGASFGTYGLLQGGVLPYTAKAVEPTVCALLSAKHFQDLYKKDPIFAAYYDEDLRHYVRTIDTEMDAAAAFLLFDTNLRDIVYRPPVLTDGQTTVLEAARLMDSEDTDTVIIEQDGMPAGLITEGDLVRYISTDAPSSTPVMDLVTRPPIALRGSERLFDAVHEMMRHRVRRVIVMNDRDTDGSHPVLGLVTSQDIAHFRGLDPVATTERLEKAQNIRELASIRTESNRRLYRLYQQGVHAEPLLTVVAEMDDLLKARLFHLVEQELREEQPDLYYEGSWAWIAFGSTGRKESALYTRQANGLVYADPQTEEEATRARDWYAALTDRAVAALGQCGYAPPEEGILASSEPYRQPLSEWRAAISQLVEGTEPAATIRGTPILDMRAIYGDEDLCDSLKTEVRSRLEQGNVRLMAILMEAATRKRPPLSFFGRFELAREEGEGAGLNVRQRGFQPIVDMARALAMEARFLRTSSTFDRLRHVAEAIPEVSQQAKSLVGAFSTLVDLHLRTQMQAAEAGEEPTDWIDPNALHKSQQNLLKETFRTIDRAQQNLSGRYERSR
jgi:CBS domain-containing protein